MRLCKCPVKSSNFYPRLLAFLQHLWYPDIHAFGIVVLVPFLARNTWGTCRDLCFLAQAHTGIPFKGKCCGWTSPCPSYHDCTMHFSKNQQETLRNEIYHLQAWRVYGTPKDHTARSQIKIERRPRNLPLLGCKGWGGVWGFAGLLCMANFKHESKNEGTGRAMVRYQGHPELSERGSFMSGGKPGSLFGCFASSCVTRLQYVCWNWMPLTWMPQHSKASCQAPTLE